ncbi:MAG: hypothetical protein JST63_04390 [Bacteroidetes bacterium]|nr:hypothetical protein [Bacteroidota bacterium]
MKKLLILFVAFIMTTGIKAQSNNSYEFISKLHQCVKFDPETKAYFVDKQVNSLSTISVANNTISFFTNEGFKSYITTIKINPAQLQSLNSKTSFSMDGIDVKTGKNVKLGFWFIGEDLDEVNYVDETSQVAIGYKDLSIVSTADAIAKDNTIARVGK